MRNSFLLLSTNGEFVTNKIVAELVSETFSTKVYKYNKRENGILRFLSCLTLFFGTLPSFLSNAILIYQFPPKIEEILCIRFHQLFRRNPIAVVHDLDFFRNIKNRGLVYSRDPNGLKMLRNSFVVIQDGPMRDWLFENGVVNLSSFNLWPYKLVSPIQNGSIQSLPNLFKPAIIYAGNLNPKKSSFLEELSKLDIELHVYGRPDPKLKIASNTPQYGEFAFDNPPNFPFPAFGLIWDGESIDGLRGTYGEYHKLNLSAKLSLYLACRIPVIVSRESAIAAFVLKNKLGIAVGSLRELPKTVSSCEWEQMSNSVLEFSQTVLTGEDLLHAIKNHLVFEKPN